MYANHTANCINQTFPAPEYLPAPHIERNPGMALDLEWALAGRTNASAVERRAAEIGARRSVKKEAQAAWLLRAIACMDLTTLAGDALLSLTYNRPLAGDDAWDAAAADFAAAHDVKVVGRSRKYKTAVGADEVREVLDVPGRGKCAYWQTEGAFTQPNANVCRSMLGWAVAATANRENGDLCELYCGNGCFTVALAPNFRRVVATELSKASVALARRNLAANGADNARVAKLSAEEFVEAFDGARTFGRLLDAGVDLGLDGRLGLVQI